MAWISLICLLALSSTAFGRSVYGGGYGSAPTYQQAPRMLSMMREQIIPRPHVSPLPLVSQAYGQQQQQPITTEWSTPLVQQQQDITFQQQPQGGYGSALVAPTIIQKTLPTQSYGQISQGYGAMPTFSQFDQQVQPIQQVQLVQPVQPVQQVQQVQLVQPLTQADILCQGQQAETVIPLENGWKFVVCLDNGKGVEQQCPKGLYYHPTSHRCERKLGPLENACAAQPCLNGGQCIPTDSSYQCQCAPGFDGTTCELDAHVCQTQQPCGQAPDTKCQSFRLGAALQFVCIFQDGLAYGLSAGQAVSSPCQGVDGPQALAVSNQGFIMCDGQRMFIDACPGGTIWDDINKACAWPDMQADSSQSDQQLAYGQSSYGQQKTFVSQPTYGNQWAVQEQLQQPKQIQQSYSAQTFVPQQFEQPKQIQQSYGAQTFVPQQVKTISSYGSQSDNQQLDQSQLAQSSSSYGAQTVVPQQLKTIQSSYGAQTLVPQQLKTISSYGSQANNRQFGESQLGQSSSYGQQWSAPHVKHLQPYGNQIVSRHFEQPQQIQQSYGAQTVIPQQLKTISSYGSQANNRQFDGSQFGQSSSYGQQSSAPHVKHLQPYGNQIVSRHFEQPQQIQQSYGAQTVVPQQFDLSQSGQSSSSYGAQTFVPQAQIKVIESSYSAPASIPQQVPQVKSVQSYGGQQKDELVSEGQSSAGYY